MTEQAAAIEAAPTEQTAAEATTPVTETPAPGAKPEAGADPDAGKAPADGAQPTTEAEAKEESTEQTADVEFKVEAPEGFGDAFKDDFAAFNEAASGWLKENPDLSREEFAQKAAAYQAERAQQAMNAMVEAHNEKVTTWLDAAKKDKEIGGDKFDENIATVIKTLEKAGGQDLIEALDQAGVGNHPGLLKLALWAAGARAQSPVLGPGGASGRKPFTETLYGTTNS